jgi:hypothetical protein
VAVGGLEAHVPLAPAGSLDDPQGLLGGEILGQRELATAEPFRERRAEALPEVVAHLAKREEIAVADRPPGPVGGEPARWHQAVDVRMGEPPNRVP